jgi:hypothetical protein
MDWIFDIEKPWCFANLFQICVSESLFDDDIYQTLTNSIILVFESFIE